MNNVKGFLTTLFVAMLSSFFILAINTNAFSSDSCVNCHKNDAFRVKNKQLFDYYKNWEDSDHDAAGIFCQDCHGGDPQKEKKEEAHAKHLSPYDESSMVYYKNTPKTCGKCHEKVYNNFIESKHFKALGQAGKGPVCITCHGNPLTSVYYTSIVLSTCTGCHNLQTNNHPELVDSAENILHRLNVSRGLLKWSSRHLDASKLNESNKLYQDISDSWHQFNFTNTEKDSKELLDQLRALFREAHKLEKKK